MIGIVVLRGTAVARPEEVESMFKPLEDLWMVAGKISFWARPVGQGEIGFIMIVELYNIHNEKAIIARIKDLIELHSDKLIKDALVVEAFNDFLPNIQPAQA